MTIRSLRIASTLLCALPLIWTACGGSDAPEDAPPAEATPEAAAAAPAPAATPATTPATAAAPAFADIAWTLVAVEPSDGDTMVPDPQAVLMLTFLSKPGPDGSLRVFGVSGCSRFVTSYTTGNNSSLAIVLDPAATQSNCPEPSRSLWAAVTKSLAGASGYSIDEGELTIRGENGSLRFSGG